MQKQTEGAAAIRVVTERAPASEVFEGYETYRVTEPAIHSLHIADFSDSHAHAINVLGDPPDVSDAKADCLGDELSERRAKEKFTEEIHAWGRWRMAFNDAVYPHTFAGAWLAKRLVSYFPKKWDNGIVSVVPADGDVPAWVRQIIQRSHLRELSLICLELFLRAARYLANGVEHMDPSDPDTSWEESWRCDYATDPPEEWSVLGGAIFEHASESVLVENAESMSRMIWGTDDYSVLGEPEHMVGAWFEWMYTRELAVTLCQLGEFCTIEQVDDDEVLSDDGGER
jgi:hypothetical protein